MYFFQFIQKIRFVESPLYQTAQLFFFYSKKINQNHSNFQELDLKNDFFPNVESLCQQTQPCIPVNLHCNTANSYPLKISHAIITKKGTYTENENFRSP